MIDSLSGEQYLFVIHSISNFSTPCCHEAVQIFELLEFKFEVSMVRKRYAALLLTALCLSLPVSAQVKQRMVLHVTPDGRQEAMRIEPGQTMKDVISRVEKGADFSLLTVRDSLTNAVGTLNSNFGFGHQDIGFQWWVPPTDGYILEFWWYDYGLRGDLGQATIRAWNANERLLTLPGTAVDATGRMGYYKDPGDGDGLVTAFKPASGDQTFYKGAGGDSAKISFDPLGTESAWKPGGIMVNLDSGKWQGIKLSDYSSTSFSVTKGKPFGFTLMNPSPKGGADARLEISSWTRTQAPYHSIKFYENPVIAGNSGWQIRSYEWGFYVIIEYTGGPYLPKLRSVDHLYTTIKTSPRPIKVIFETANTFAGEGRVMLFNKKNGQAWDSTQMTRTVPYFTGTVMGANPYDTVSYYVVGTEVSTGLQARSPIYTYTIFVPKEKTLALYSANANPTGLTINDMVPRYMRGIAAYDTWDVKHSGVDDLPDLFQNYNTIIEIGSVGGTSGMPTLTNVGAWLQSGTQGNPKLYFLSDQDHGWISNFADTTFADTNVHAQYFGVKTLGPQDICYYPAMGSRYVDFPWNIIPSASDSLTGYLDQYGKADSVTLWYDPYFELGFDNWFDNIIPTPDATVIFRDTTTLDAAKWTDSNFPMLRPTPALRKNRVLGVRKSDPNRRWATVYLAFDYLAMNFRSDTSMHPSGPVPTDPKYNRSINVGNIAQKFSSIWDEVIIGVGKTDAALPGAFALEQNYPNPFNPATTIAFDLPTSTHVTLIVYDCLGRQVLTLINGQRPAGHYEEKFSADALGSGIYFYRLTAGNFSAVKKMLVLK